MMNQDMQLLIENLEEREYLLPVGYLDSDGTLHRKIKLKIMTGEMEEAIGQKKFRANGGKLITELIFQITEKIGDLPKVNRDMVKQLTSIDRDFIILKNRQQFGDNVSYEHRCPYCNSKNTVNVDLSNIKTKYWTEESRELSFELPVGVYYKDKLHKNITITMPNGIVQEKVASIVNTNPASATTMMLFLITKKIEGIDFLNPSTFKKMTKKDRDFITKQLDKFDAGISFAVNSGCWECGEEFESAIPLQHLLGE